MQRFYWGVMPIWRAFLCLLPAFANAQSVRYSATETNDIRRAKVQW
jgi:hypothetical protein